jgi:formamidopyrimidine-DNA glycosylase
MDKPQDEKGDDHRDTVVYLPQGDSCDKCGSTQSVQKFDGSYLCKDCRNQHAEMQF